MFANDAREPPRTQRAAWLNSRAGRSSTSAVAQVGGSVWRRSQSVSNRCQSSTSWNVIGLFRGQCNMPPTSFAHVGVSFHHDESSPGVGAEIAKSQAINGRKPERTAMHHERDRRGVRTTVGPRSSENTIGMSIKERRELVAIERIRFGPAITKTRCRQLVARALDRKQFVNIHQLRIGRSAIGQDVTLRLGQSSGMTPECEHGFLRNKVWSVHGTGPGSSQSPLLRRRSSGSRFIEAREPCTGFGIDQKATVAAGSSGAAN